MGNNKSTDDKPHYFLEEIYHSHSRETDYWLGTYGKNQRVWLGSGETKTREEAMEVAMAIVIEHEKSV